MTARIGGCSECGAMPVPSPTIYENITIEDLVSQYFRERPTVFWEIGRDLLPQLKLLKDDNSRYIMNIGTQNTLFGHAYRIVDGRGLRLVTGEQS